jgi:hypothetical protein
VTHCTSCWPRREGIQRTGADWKGLHMLQGGCFCGNVRYEAEGPPEGPSVCHCIDCRRASGAPMVAWFGVARSRFRLVAGSPADFGSSPGVTRQFCPRCGTPLTFRAEANPDKIDVATATLDDPSAVPPSDHTWTRQQLDWVVLGDGLPRYPEGHDRSRE